MRKLVKGASLAAVMALAALTAVSAGASAESLTFEPAGPIAAASLGKLTLAFGGSRFECNWTLRGTIREGAIAASAGASLGSIGSASATECSSGSTVTFLHLAWPLTYQTAEGSLPNSVEAFGIAIEGFNLRISSFGGLTNCLYEGNQLVYLFVTGRNPYSSRLLVLEPTSLARRGGVGCPASGTMSGELALEPAQTITAR